MTDCPFCDFKAGFSQELACHLANSHQDKLPAGIYGRDSGSVKCWCGEGPFAYLYPRYEAISQFCVHLQRHGGAMAHWLAHGLGLEANPFGPSVPYTRRTMP